MQEKKEEERRPKESRAIRSHAISGSIGRFGENNEVNGSAAPPSSSKEDAPDLRDEKPNKETAPAPTASTTAILDEIADVLDTVVLSFYLSFYLVRLAVRPILFDTISCLQTLRQQWFCASQSLLCQSTKAKLSTSHHRAPHSSAQLQSQQSQQSLRSLSRPRLLSAACCSLATAPCLASRRLALPCIHSVLRPFGRRSPLSNRIAGTGIRNPVRLQQYGKPVLIDNSPQNLNPKGAFYPTLVYHSLH